MYCPSVARTRLAVALAALALTLPGVAAAQTARRDSAPTPPPAQAQSPAPAAADVSSVDAIVAALYDVISGPPGKKRDWDRFRSLFAPGARLIPTGRRRDGSTGARVIDAEGYIASSGPFLENEGFFEREVARRSERFGNIAHVFSTYESRHTPADAAPFARGINSIQLYHDGTRWWVMTVMWDSERPDNPIPAQYLEGRHD
jgi:hypothetical protein